MIYIMTYELPLTKTCSHTNYVVIDSHECAIGLFLSNILVKSQYITVLSIIEESMIILNYVLI